MVGFVMIREWLAMSGQLLPISNNQIWIVHVGGSDFQTPCDDATDKLGTNVNGWKIGTVFGDAVFFNGDWLKRAAAAKFGIFGNSTIEAVYPIATQEADGALLDGSKRNYTLTFPPHQLPPVQAFWSITMYDPKTTFLIQNPINRYLINSPMLPNLKKGADGSITLYIQKNSPGGDKEANWLPSPDGPLYLAMRLYYPNVTPPPVGPEP
jgi:hypothetical protein